MLASLLLSFDSTINTYRHGQGLTLAASCLINAFCKGFASGRPSLWVAITDSHWANIWVRIGSGNVVERTLLLRHAGNLVFFFGITYRPIQYPRIRVIHSVFHARLTDFQFSPLHWTNLSHQDDIPDTGSIGRQGACPVHAASFSMSSPSYHAACRRWA